MAKEAVAASEEGDKLGTAPERTSDADGAYRWAADGAEAEAAPAVAVTARTTALATNMDTTLPLRPTTPITTTTRMTTDSMMRILMACKS